MKVDGKEIAQGLRLIEQHSPASTLREFTLVQSVAGRLSGGVGTAVRWSFSMARTGRSSASCDRAQPRGAIARLGNLPPLHFWVEARKVRPDVGYLRFNMFFEPEALMESVSRIMQECADCRGFVIDLRGNPGGIGGLATGLAGWFIDRAGNSARHHVSAVGPGPFRGIPAAPDRSCGPLAVLVDGCSASTAEIFAGGMKDLGRARIFGTRTAGAALPSMFERLPNGDGFQYAIANYISQGGKAAGGSRRDSGRRSEADAPRSCSTGQDPVLERARGVDRDGQEVRRTT